MGNNDQAANQIRLILVDPDAGNTQKGSITASWCVPHGDHSTHSIPALVDRQALRIRAEYLAWCKAIALSEIDGVALEDHLRWPDCNISFWQMSQIAEKSPMKSSSVYFIFKLRALEIFYEESNCYGLEYKGKDPLLAMVLKAWMDKIGHPFRSRSKASWRTPSLLSRFASAWAYLGRKLWSQVRHNRWVEPIAPISASTQVPLTVFTHFPNFDTDAAKQGHFRSRYWEGLHDVFMQSGRPVNWIWLFADTGDLTYQQARSFADRFNVESTDRHMLLEQFSSLGTVGTTLKRYVRLVLTAIRLSPPRNAFKLVGSNIQFFPVLKSEWYESLLGSSAMANSWFSSLLDQAARQLPQSAATLYPWENLPWEQALIGTWRTHRREITIGHQHGLPAPLNLRYIPSSRSLLPDWLVTGGPWPRQITLAGGVSPERITMCEAVRYEYLARLSAHAATGQNFLIITSLLESETVRLLTLAAKAFQSGGLRQFAQIVVKPHPFRAVDMVLRSLGVEQDFKLTTQSLGDLWPSTAVAFVANSTAAGVDALYAGVPFVIGAAGDMMNLNPLFPLTGVASVSTPEELEHALRNASPPDSAPGYLFLDPALPRWRELLTDLRILAPADGTPPAVSA